MDVFLGLGSNLGDREQNLHSAISELRNFPRTKIRQTAAFYDTAPVGYAAQPRFLNTAVWLETELSPAELLERTQDLEKKLGREPTFHHGPRLIDIDILAYGTQIIDTENLHIPHPELPRRDFVLRPLCDLVPDFIDVRSGKTYGVLWTECLAADLAQELQPGAVVALNGDLGTGKTTFVRACVQSLGSPSQVTSPTFAILNIYAGKNPVYHFDFYRLYSAADLENIGGTEFIPSVDGITFIEWAEKIPEVLPEDYLEIRISAKGEQRIFEFVPHGRTRSRLATRTLS